MKQKLQNISIYICCIKGLSKTTDYQSKTKLLYEIISEQREEIFLPFSLFPFPFALCPQFALCPLIPARPRLRVRLLWLRQDRR